MMEETPSPEREATCYTDSKVIAELEHQFTYHSPVGDQPERYGRIREAALRLALQIERDCPPSADRSAAFRKIREAVMTANAAIACGESIAPTIDDGATGDPPN